jgi:hypothetical protein
VATAKVARVIGLQVRNAEAFGPTFWGSFLGQPNDQADGKKESSRPEEVFHACKFTEP